MPRERIPVTNALRVLREHGVRYTDHPYDYEPRGGTSAPARALGVDEHAVIKTLIMEDDGKRPMIVLMHGDREVSAKNLARFLDVKHVAPCDPAVANRATRSAARVRSARDDRCRSTWSAASPSWRISTSTAGEGAISWGWRR